MTDTNRSDTTDTPRRAAPRSKAAKAATKARKAVEQGAESVRQQASAAIDAGAAAVDSAPLSALAGAIALGAVAAALIPATARELSAIGPFGEKMRGALDEAFAAAKAAGAEQLSAKGVTATAATAGLGQLLGSVVKAVVSANSAAGDTLRVAQSKDVPPATSKAPPPQGS